ACACSSGLIRFASSGLIRAANRRSVYVRSTAPRTRRSATTCRTPALASSATWRYRLPGGTSSSSVASSPVVSARSPRNALMIRNRTGWSRRSALATRDSLAHCYQYWKWCGRECAGWPERAGRLRADALPTAFFDDGSSFVGFSASRVVDAPTGRQERSEENVHRTWEQI